MDALLQWLHLPPAGVALVLTGISVLYFLCSRELSTSRRIVKSSHGLFFALQLVPVAVRDAFAAINGPWLTPFFYTVMVLGLAGVATSMRGFGKPWYFHLTHVLTFAYAALAQTYGYQALIA